jgi:hypothetical protein
VDWITSGLSAWGWGFAYGAILFLMATALISYGAGQLAERFAVVVGRILKKRAGLDDLSLRRKVQDGKWTLIFNPRNIKGKKRISFQRDGFVGMGHNQNEHRWRVNNGLLEIFREDDKPQSRFAYIPETNEFIHTNDEDTKSLRDQRIIPELK